MGGAEDVPKPWLPDGKLECPVGPAAQAWIESSMHWCTEDFGTDLLLRGTVLPRDLPPSYTASPAQIGELVDRACALMSVDRAHVKLDLFDGSAEKKAARSGKARTVGHFHMEGGRAVIGLDLAEAEDPAHLLAIIAHELCHVRLIGEGRIARSRPDQERLTDLLCVYFGFGLFTANASFRYANSGRGWSVEARGYLDDRTLNAARNDGYHRLGYLNEREFGYALACYCRLRRETDPAWAAYLEPGARAALRQGLAYLAHAGPGQELPTQRAANKSFKYKNITITVLPRAVGSSSPSSFVLPVEPRRPMRADTKHGQPGNASRNRGGRAGRRQ